MTGVTPGIGMTWNYGLQAQSSSQKAFSMQTPQSVTMDQVREQLRDTSAALAAALRSFKSESKPVYSESVLTTPARLAAINGRAPRLGAVLAVYSTVRTTEAITTATSTIRSSSAVLNLDTASAETPSQVYSAATGVDFTSNSKLRHLAGFESVTTGSFVVDGHTIEVTDNDTIDSIVAQVNGSGARVVAAVDAGQNRLSFTDLFNSEDEVSIGDDTSGFLQAAGIDRTNTIRGNLRDDRQVFTNSSQFGAVTDGTFKINGVSFNVDADQDTLESLLNVINSSGAGVNVRYDSSDDRIFVEPAIAGDTLAIEDDASGFWAAAKIQTGVIGTHVNADAAFNATGASGPLFDGGMSVVAGSFTVNGVIINVAADDSVRSVLDKVNQSAADVTATYDDDTQTISLLSTRPDGQAITMGADTSGFLAAVKLDGTAATSTVSESVDAEDVPVAYLSEYSGVHSGTLTINGRTIAIDPLTTTLRASIQAIDALPELAANNNPATGRVSILAETARPLRIADTSGLFSTLAIKGKTYLNAPPITEVVQAMTGTTTESNAEDVAETVESLSDHLNELLETLEGMNGGSILRRDIADQMRLAVDLIGQAGLDGLDMVTVSSKLQMSADAVKIAASLDASDGVLKAPLELFAKRMATIDPIRSTSDPINSSSSRQLQQFVNSYDLDLARIRSYFPNLLPKPSTEQAIKAYSVL